MAKSKGNRIQVILECTEHKESGQLQERLVTSQRKIERTLLREWKSRNSTQC